MKPFEHLSDDALIEFHLHDSDYEAAIRQHLEICAECSRLSDSIAETLRVFSASPVPQSNVDHKWQRLRGALPAPPKRRLHFSLRSWSVAGLAFAATVVILFTIFKPSNPKFRHGETEAVVRPETLAAAVADSQIAEQLDSAERLLTVVNHTSGALDDTTREQAHDLLLKNAIYIRTAREQGDFGTAVVLDGFGRILTNICHEPRSQDNGSNLRREWNTTGLLFDVRILQQGNAGSRPLANKEN